MGRRRGRLPEHQRLAAAREQGDQEQTAQGSSTREQGIGNHLRELSCCVRASVRNAIENSPISDTFFGTRLVCCAPGKMSIIEESPGLDIPIIAPRWIDVPAHLNDLARSGQFVDNASDVLRMNRLTPGRAGRKVVETGAVARIVSQRLVKMRAILFRLEQRQERSEQISDEAEIEAGARLLRRCV